MDECAGLDVSFDAGGALYCTYPKDLPRSAPHPVKKIYGERWTIKITRQLVAYAGDNKGQPKGSS